MSGPYRTGLTSHQKACVFDHTGRLIADCLILGGSKPRTGLECEYKAQMVADALNHYETRHRRRMVLVNVIAGAIIWAGVVLFLATGCHHG